MLGSFQTSHGSNSGFVDDEYKMVLVVRNDLKIGKGKMAAQVSFNPYSPHLLYMYLYVKPPCSVLMLLLVAISV